MLTAITELEPRFRRSGQQQILLETILVRFALLDHTVGIEEVLEAIGQPRGGGGSGGAAGARHRRLLRLREARRAAGHAGPQRDPDRGGRPAHAAASPAAPAAEGLGAQALHPRPDRELRRSTSGTASSPASTRMAARCSPPPSATRPPSPSPPPATSPLELEPAGAIYEQPINSGAADVLTAIRTIFPTAARLLVRVAITGPVDIAPKRITAESVKAERLATLRKKDPALDAAVDCLDLELLD